MVGGFGALALDWLENTLCVALVWLWPSAFQRFARAVGNFTPRAFSPLVTAGAAMVGGLGALVPENTLDGLELKKTCFAISRFPREPPCVFNGFVAASFALAFQRPGAIAVGDVTTAYFVGYFGECRHHHQ